MTTLGIFTVKRLCRSEGRYYTYGGFGDYLAAMRASFRQTVLVAHVKESTPPAGYYLIPPGNDLEVVPLPQVRSEVGTWLYLPLVTWRSWRASARMDVAHARMPNHTGVLGAMACRIRGVPVFCQIIADWHLEAQRMPVSRKCGLGLLMKLHMYLYDRMERSVCKEQLVFAQGRSCFEKHRPHSDCELVLSSAHHRDDVVPPTPRFQKAPYVILTVARLNNVKNQRLVLEALAMLRGTGEDWRVVLVGEGPQRAELKREAGRLGVLAAVRLVGQVERGRELWAHYDAADCFVLPSRSEGTPKVLLEAMARGLPVIAADVAGIPSTVAHEERGLLFRDNDVGGLVSALRRMATENALRRSVTRKAHVFSLEHTVERATETMLEKVRARWPGLDIKRGPS